MSRNYDHKGGGVRRLMEKTILNLHFDYFIIFLNVRSFDKEGFTAEKILLIPKV